MISMTATPVPTRTCQGMKNASLGGLFGHVAEEARGADAQAVADGADDDRLQQIIRMSVTVGDAQGLERAELADVFDGEQVKGLADDGRADDEAQEHGDAEVDRDARLSHVVARSWSR